MWQREAWPVSGKLQVGIEGSGKLLLTRVYKDSNNAFHIQKKKKTGKFRMLHYKELINEEIRKSNLTMHMCVDISGGN